MLFEQRMAAEHANLKCAARLRVRRSLHCNRYNKILISKIVQAASTVWNGGLKAKGTLR
jgi:hypothetical protein